MSLKLTRIDDRLIHGQVILGWVPALKPDRILVKRFLWITKVD